LPNTKGVLTWEEMRKWLNLNSGFFETSQYTFDTQMPTVVGNFDQAGMSHGNAQLNYAYANPLNRLYTYLFENHEQVIRDAFGTETAKFDEFKYATLNYTQDELLAWGDSLTDWASDPDGKLLKSNWAQLFKNLLVTQECIDQYLVIEETDYIPDALFLFKQMPMKSRGALASIFDLKLNRGRIYGVNTILVDFEAVEADTTLSEDEKEAKKIEILNLRGNDTTNAITSTTWKERRECMAYMGGDYHGSFYDPENQFNINLEPAIIEKADTFNINIGNIKATNVFGGNSPVKSVYAGSNLIAHRAEPFTTTRAPMTQYRTNPNSYVGLDKSLTSITLEEGQPIWVDVQNWVACKTYYTTDGSTPTTNSPVYYEELTFTESCTLKTLTVSLSGVAEAVRSINIDIPVPVPSGYRYVRQTMKGGLAGTTHTDYNSILEFQAISSAEGNVLLNKKNLEGWTGQLAGTSNTDTTITDGNTTTWNYCVWSDSSDGVAKAITYDLGKLYTDLTEIKTWHNYASTGRFYNFGIQVSPDNVNWTTVVDLLDNETTKVAEETSAGFTYTVPY
jgi:hypothetical protein